MNSSVLLAVASVVLFVSLIQVGGIPFTEVDDLGDVFNNCLEYNMSRIIGGKISCVLSLTRGDYVIAPDVGAYKIHNRETTWHNARKICSAEGGHLAVMDSPQKYELFQTWLGTNISSIWLGFHDLFEEGTWLTVTGESVESIGYWPWSSGEPNGYKDQDTDCGYLRSSGMADWSCDKTCNAFLCEINLCKTLGYRVRDC